MRPAQVNLTCQHCRYQWLEPITTLVAAEVVVYRDEEQVARRRLDCPNCGNGVVVKVPSVWLEHD